MNVSAGYSGGCSASIKTSVTVQHERKKTCLPSAVRDVNACSPGWDKLLISVRLPAVNRRMGSGSVLSSRTRIKTGWNAHALLPPLQPGACSHTHQEPATNSCSLSEAEMGQTWLSCRCWSWGQSQLLHKKMLLSALGYLKSKCWALSGIKLKSKCQQGVPYSSGVHKSRSWMDSLRKMVQLPLNILLSALKKKHLSSLSLELAFFSFSFLIFSGLDYETCTRVPKCFSFLGEISHPRWKLCWICP